MSETRFMTTAEVAAIVRVPIETVRYWRHVGKGPKSFKVPGGRRVLYAVEDVEAWLSSPRGVPEEEARVTTEATAARIVCPGCGHRIEIRVVR